MPVLIEQTERRGAITWNQHALTLEAVVETAVDGLYEVAQPLSVGIALQWSE